MWAQTAILGDYVVAQLFYDAALGLGALIALALLRRHGSISAVLAIVAVAFLGLYGSRLAFEILVHERGLLSYVYVDAFRELWRGEATIIGAILGGAAGVLVAWRVLRIPFSLLASSVVISAACAQSVGRFGCLANGCCFGLPTSMPWGVRYPLMSYAGWHSGPMPLHPTPVYASFGLALLAVLLGWMWSRRQVRFIPGAYLMGYGLIRSIVQSFRADIPATVFGATWAHLLSVVMIAVGGVWLAMEGRRQEHGFASGSVIATPSPRTPSPSR